MALRDVEDNSLQVYDRKKDTFQRVAQMGVPQGIPIWSPDGRYILFPSVGGGISWTRWNRPGEIQRLTQTKNSQSPFSFTLDGKRLAYVEFAKEGQGIYTVSVDDDGGHLTVGKPQPFRVDQRIISTAPSFSPDGQWLAYNSDATGTQEVYVSAFPSGPTWPISHGGGVRPVWWPKTNELFYQSGDKIMAVSYTTHGDTFEKERPPHVWLEKLGGVQPVQWDLAPDGKRLLVLAPVATPEPPKPDHEVTFLLNFFDYLRQRVPVNK